LTFLELGYFVKDLHLLDLDADGLIDIFYAEKDIANDNYIVSMIYSKSSNYKLMTTDCLNQQNIEYKISQKITTTITNLLYKMYLSNNDDMDNDINNIDVDINTIHQNNNSSIPN